MITRISDKTSLLDLSFAELKQVAWEVLDKNDFREEIVNPTLINRLIHTAPSTIAGWHNQSSLLTWIGEKALESVILANYKIGNDNFTFCTSMFQNENQYSIEFLTKYHRHIELYHAEFQNSITPEFLYEHRDEMDLSGFFGNFASTKGVESYKEFATFNDGYFLDDIESSNVLEYATIDDCIAFGITPPKKLYTIMNEQRVMSGDPCNDGQRSYAIWLRKYRRVYNDPEGYPTWNNLLELYKKHPRMNANGYVDWLAVRAVNNKERDVSRSAPNLSYSASRISVNDYREITGLNNNTEAQQDFEQEFMDIHNPEEFKRVVEQVYEANPELAQARQQEAEERQRQKEERAAARPPRHPETGRFMSRADYEQLTSGS